VVHIHGDAGLGKSALTTMFLELMRTAGAKTIRLDCHSIEPTERGVLEALGRVCCASTPDRPFVPTDLCRW